MYIVYYYFSWLMLCDHHTFLHRVIWLCNIIFFSILNLLKTIVLLQCFLINKHRNPYHLASTMLVIYIFVKLWHAVL